MTVYVMERIVEMSPKQQCCVIVDMSALTRETLDLRMAKTVFEIMNVRYPGVCGVYCIVNQPMFFATAYKMLKGKLSRDLKQRVVLMGTQKRGRLFAFVDESSVPIDYGGKLDYNSRDFIRTRYKVEGFDFQNKGASGGAGEDASSSSSSKLQGKKAVYARILETLCTEPSVEEVLPGCSKSGFINKESKWTKRWQKQYFVLNKNIIYYYESKKAKIPDGIFGLANIVIRDGNTKTKLTKKTNPVSGVSASPNAWKSAETKKREGEATSPSLGGKSRPHSFCIVTPIRIWNFYCDSEQEKIDWMDAIRKEMI